MKLFDFHHHSSNIDFGIYNLPFLEEIPHGYFSAGIHPDSISNDNNSRLHWLKEVSRHPNCRAIGECGLDGLISIEDHLQEDVFLQQIELANEIQKPLIIHCVKRFSQLLHFRKKSKVPMIVHGFNKRKSIGEDLLKHDFYLSFGKSVLHNVNLQEFLKNFPTDKLFLETDSATFSFAELYQITADLKKISVEELNQKIKDNLQKLQISI